MPLYFAYGSNMDLEQMGSRCPASVPVGTARLARHRVVVMREGYASVVRDPRRTVWGLLWDLALADVAPLDRYEGVSGGLYTKAHLPVLAGQGPRRALVYLGRNGGPGVPRPGYMEGVVAAARKAGLPERYLAELSAHIPFGAKLPPGQVPEPPQGTPAVRPRHATPFDPRR